MLPAIKANALYGGGYPLFTALGRPLIAKLAVEYARAHGCDTIAHGCTGKGNDQVRIEATVATLGAGAQDHRPGARLADGPRGGDRLRPRARHPGQGRHRDRALLDRRQPLGPLLGGPLDRGPRARPRGRRLPAGHPAGGGARRARDRHGRASRPASRSRFNGERLDAGRAARTRRRGRLPPRRRHRRPHRGPHRRPQGARHLRGAGRGDPPARAPGAREARLDDPPEQLQARRSTASGPTWSTPGSGGSRCAPTSTPTWTRSTSR